jgi:hypothetical protein
MIHIVIHILPQEIDQLEQLLVQLKRNSVHLPKDHHVFVNITMNMNLTDWKKSSFPRDYFYDKFRDLEKLTKSWAITLFVWDSAEVVNGCNDARRIAIESTTCQYVMYLDADNVFGDYFLWNMYNACQNRLVPEGKNYSVITPQTTRMWDNTWDIITNDEFINEEASHKVYDVRDPYEAINVNNHRSIRLKLISGFKFAGWGTTISSDLAKFINIPESLGSYGLDDTFIMMCCYMMREKGLPVYQYILENEIIIENNKFRTNPYKDYIATIDKRQEFLAIAEANFNPELENFKLRL